MEGNLGRFEIENDRKAIEKMGLDIEPSETFPEFKCWGLKRYCEVRYTEKGRLQRKSAFAGMHDEEQSNLMDWETDGREYEWKQNGKKTMKYGAVIVEATKHMKAEDIWDNGESEVPEPKKNIDLSSMKTIYNQLKEAEVKLL